MLERSFTQTCCRPEALPLRHLDLELDLDLVLELVLGLDHWPRDEPVYSQAE